MTTPQLLLGKERTGEGLIQHYQLMQDGELKVNSSGLEPRNVEAYQFQLLSVGRAIGEELRNMGAQGYQVVNGKRFDTETRNFVRLEEFNSLELVLLTQQIQITGGLLALKVA